MSDFRTYGTELVQNCPWNEPTPNNVGVRVRVRGIKKQFSGFFRPPSYPQGTFPFRASEVDHLHINTLSIYSKIR